MSYSELIFNKIENGLIFSPDFRTFVNNNIIKFSNAGIAIVYGPNGTGKTSLSKVFSAYQDTSLNCDFDGNNYTNGNKLFHVINDQNNRNIIAGTAKDFLLGDNIKKEFELQNETTELFKNIISDSISLLKDKFKISTTTNPLIGIIENNDFKNIIKDFSNKNSKGANIDIESLLSTLSNFNVSNVDNDYSDDKLAFFCKEFSDKKSYIHKVLEIVEPDITKVHNAQEIEEDTTAIEILNHYKEKTKCIVCDFEGINSEMLISKKELHRQSVIDSLTEQMKTFFDSILSLEKASDPFDIKENILLALENGDYHIIENLQSDIKQYISYFNLILINEFKQQEKLAQLESKFNELKTLISEKPEISEEDYIYIEEILSNSMDKKIDVVRDENKNLKILLEEKEFLGKDRNELPLSSGEQNFLSLCFEFLKAKNSNKKIIILDDPISSFDSIYKNKVVFAMVKMLENKPRIILTHNIDLLRLLESQYSNSFKLYLLNNSDGENNGFISLSKDEKKMLINLKELLNNFRYEIFNYIESPEMFLISMIPFMRGYATIIDDKDNIENLTELMHGYKTGKVDVAKVYYKLFGTEGNQILPDSLEITVDDLLSKTVDGITIVDSRKYPLLNKTLKHSFSYLFLRLLVEKTLVEKYNIDTNQYEQLGAIINQAFQGNDVLSIRNRVRLTSKKTLINEFNHFEGNLSIFQPAIDITERVLGAEKTDILSFVDIIRNS